MIEEEQIKFYFFQGQSKNLLLSVPFCKAELCSRAKDILSTQRHFKRRQLSFYGSWGPEVVPSSKKWNNCIKFGPSCGTNFCCHYWNYLQRNHPRSICGLLTKERARIIAWWSYLIFIYLFSLFSSCVAEVLEHEHTQYDCPSLSSSTSIYLPHLHLFCLHSFFFWLELDHNLLIFKSKMCQPCFFKICFFSLKLNYI